MALIDELRAKHGNKGVNPPEGQASLQEQAQEKIKTADIKPKDQPQVFMTAGCSDEQILAACLRALFKRLG